MPSNRRNLLAAAGAGGEALYVEDVFSTYLYTGTGSSQTITNGIALADGIGGGTSTEFGGTSDNLKRSSDLTGNADGKTFTISVWVYKTENTTDYVYQSTGNVFQLAWIGGSLRFFADDGADVINTSFATDYLPTNTWIHFLAGDRDWET